LFCGSRDPVTGKVGSVSDSEQLKQIPDLIPQATLSAAESLLTENKVFSRAPTGFSTMTVKSIVTTISKFKGLHVDDDKQKNFLMSCAENLIETLDSHLSRPLSEFSVYDVIHLLESLNLRNYCAVFQENAIDGPTLMNCKSLDEVINLGITFTAKARILFKEIVKFKSTIVPLTLLSEDNCDVKDNISEFSIRNSSPSVSFLTLESSYLSVEQDRNKIELINLQTKVIEELKKQVEELSPKRGSFIKKTKPLSELSVDEVIHLLESLNLSNFCYNFKENMIDGPTLMNCKSEDDVKELGIAYTAKARRLYEEIVKFKSTGVPLTLLSEEHHREVPEMINCDDGGTDLSTMTNSIP